MKAIKINSAYIGEMQISYTYIQIGKYEIDNNKICSNLKCKNLLTNSVIFPIITTLVALIM